MTRALLDINVLLALLDQTHIDHSRARVWLESNIEHGWASCPLTQNGFVRVISQPRYPSSVTPNQAMSLLAGATATEHHAFWADTVSILDEQIVVRSHILGPRHLTDAYLLALATSQGGRFVTFDRAVPAKAVRGATPANLAVI